MMIFKKPIIHIFGEKIIYIEARFPFDSLKFYVIGVFAVNT
jgi:hypothetical protein